MTDVIPGSGYSSPKGKEVRKLRKQESAEHSYMGSGTVSALKEDQDSPTPSANSPVF